MAWNGQDDYDNFEIQDNGEVEEEVEEEEEIGLGGGNARGRRGEDVAWQLAGSFGKCGVRPLQGPQDLHHQEHMEGWPC